MKVSMQTGGLALAMASALAAGCATTEPDTALYGTPVTLKSSTPTTREVIVERVPAREVVVERAPAREVIVERAPPREVVVERVPSDRVVVERYVERVPSEVGPGGQAVLMDGSVVNYDREIYLRSSTRAITVQRGEVVRFVAADGSSFIWRFNTQENTSFPLSTIAPSNVPTNPSVMVHVVGPSRVGRSN